MFFVSFSLKLRSIYRYSGILAGFTQTEIHRKKPTYATIIGVKG